MNRGTARTLPATRIIATIGAPPRFLLTMKTLLPLLAAFLIAPWLRAADAKPAEVKPAPSGTAEAKIARLEERVARLERIVEKLAAPPSPQLLGSRGPTAEDRARYESLSDQAKSEFRDALRAQGDQLRELPEEERRKFIVAMFEKVQAADKKRASEGAVKAPKEQPGEKPPAKP